MGSAVPRIQALRLIPGAGGRALIGRAAAAGCLGSIIAAAVLGATDSDTATLACLVAGQAAGVALFATMGWDDSRRWATAGVITAAGWTLTFLVPSAVYLVDPNLLDVTATPVETMALVNLGLFGLIAGGALVHMARRGSTTARAYRISVPPRYSRRWLLLWLGVGLLGFALVFQRSGGLVEYISNLDDEGRNNLGRTYFIWMALFTRYAIQILVYRRWAVGRNAGPGLALLLTVAIGATALLGARLFVAVALVELALFYAWTRRPAPLRKVVPLVAVLAAGLILVGGAVKRYQDSESPNQSFADYLWSTAPQETADAYVNNYADGVRLIALAVATVPDHAGYEYGDVLLRYALQPLPRAIRPEYERPPALKRAMYPGGGYAHAIPLHAIAYLQAGPAVVLLLFGVLGAAIRWLDTCAYRVRYPSFTRLVVLSSVAAAIPSFIRSAEAGGAALAALDIAGLAVVAVTVVERKPVLDRARTSA